MRPTLRPASAKKIGNRPQARPSLRLLTSPAWLHDDSAFSVKLVSRKTSPVVRSSWSCSLAGDVVGGFVLGVAAGLADEQRRQAEAERRRRRARGRTARAAARRARRCSRSPAR